jgi:hypothetical protein
MSRAIVNPDIARKPRNKPMPTLPDVTVNPGLEPMNTLDFITAVADLLTRVILYDTLVALTIVLPVCALIGVVKFWLTNVRCRF